MASDSRPSFALQVCGMRERRTFREKHGVWYVRSNLFRAIPGRNSDQHSRVHGPARALPILPEQILIAPHMQLHLLFCPSTSSPSHTEYGQHMYNTLKKSVLKLPPLSGSAINKTESPKSTPTQRLHSSTSRPSSPDHKNAPRRRPQVQCSEQKDCYSDRW